MKKELEQKLYKLCPNLYYDPNNEFCMIETGSGWFSLIEELSIKLEQLIMQYPSNERQQYRVIQVKEKFGTLAFYLNSSSEEMDKLIQEATNMSAQVCEVCGGFGKIHTNSWLVRTRCEKHLMSKRV